MPSSPGRHRRDRHGRDSHSRSRSPARRHEHEDQQRRRRRSSPPAARPAVQLPMGALPVSRRDYDRLRNLFELYLDIQKGLVLEDLDDREARGRWKSFVGKWNRGELAEGWYDPTTLVKANQHTRSPSPRAPPPEVRREARPTHADQSDDEYGPSLPATIAAQGVRRATAAVPSAQDLKLRREMDEEDREEALEAHRHERRAHRKEEQARLDELAPKADAGTRERQMEKKREAAASNRAFATSKTEAGGVSEVREEDLMGGADGADEYRRMKKERERKKNDREIRREELFRAKQAEREERMQAYREKEDQTMAGLIALAKQRFG